MAKAKPAKILFLARGKTKDGSDAKFTVYSNRRFMAIIPTPNAAPQVNKYRWAPNVKTEEDVLRNIQVRFKVTDLKKC